jgi:hypothetical protein
MLKVLPPPLSLSLSENYLRRHNFNPFSITGTPSGEAF